MNSSNKNSVSLGPELASGWNCAEKNGRVLWRMPSFVPSFMLTNSGSQSEGRESLSSVFEFVCSCSGSFGQELIAHTYTAYRLTDLYGFADMLHSFVDHVGVARTV